MNEFKQWHQLPNTNTTFNFLRLKEEDGKLEVTLVDDSDRVLKIDFMETIAYRVIPRNLNDNSDIEELSSLIYYCTDSSFILEIKKVSQLIDNILHFRTVTSDTTIDVVCTGNPHIAWNNNLFGDAI